MESKSDKTRKDYKTENKKYRSQLRKNKRTIKLLAKTKYPYLYKILNAYSGSLQKRLFLFLDAAIKRGEYHRAVKDSNDLYWYSSYRYLAGIEYGKYRDFCKKINLLCAFGLIVKVKSQNKNPTEFTLIDRQNLGHAINRYNGKYKTVDPNFIVDKTIYKKNIRATNLYHIPEYSKEILREANNRARIWLDSKTPMRAISKRTFIRVFGQKIADIVYYSKVTLSTEDKAMEQELIIALKELLEVKPILMIGELIRWAGGDLEAIQSCYTSARSRILAASNAQLRPPTKKEVETWGLPNRAHIISTLPPQK